MDNVPIAGQDAGEQLFKRFLAQYDVPAYVLRAQQVQDAYDGLLGRCRQQRDQWLLHVRTRLGRLYALAGSWETLANCVAEEDLCLLQRMYAELAPRLHAPVTPISSGRVLRRAVAELGESIERFNRRWHEFLHQVDLAPLNELREGYNRYYLLEKECAVHSARLARQGFVRLPPFTRAELTVLLPALPAPRVRAAV
jgi:hypothetical protein